MHLILYIVLYSWVYVVIYLGENVKIGNNVKISSNVSIDNCIIGDNVIIHPGVCIGQDGFGFLPDEMNKKKPQEGIVKLGNNVEIGSNCTIDRGSWRDTILNDNTKLDNMVRKFSFVLLYYN